MSKEQEDIVSKIKNWQKVLRDSATGPLMIAQEVVAGEESWDMKANKGVSYSSALERALGKGRDLSFFRRRAYAVNRLGGMRNARMFHHQAAVWFHSKVPREKTEMALKICADQFNRNHSCPLAQNTLFRILGQVCGIPPKTRIHHCVSCEEKDKQLAELQAKVETLEEDRQEKQRAQHSPKPL